MPPRPERIPARATCTARRQARGGGGPRPRRSMKRDVRGVSVRTGTLPRGQLGGTSATLSSWSANTCVAKATSPEREYPRSDPSGPYPAIFGGCTATREGGRPGGSACDHTARGVTHTTRTIAWIVGWNERSNVLLPGLLAIIRLKTQILRHCLTRLIQHISGTCVAT